MLAKCVNDVTLLLNCVMSIRLKGSTFELL